jgi:hypothetical protein
MVDDILNSNVLELACEATKLPATFVQCPADEIVPNTIGLKLPYIYFQIRNVRMINFATPLQKMQL